MSRNANSRFAQNPTNLDISRSKFNRDASVKTSGNVGDLIPFYLEEVLPGDTFQIKTNKVVRFQPMVTAPMDNVYMDTYYFFVPGRLLWKHWKEFFGENTESAWIPETEYQIPQIEAPSGGWNVGTIADYFGLPVGVDGISVSALPFRAYAMIVDQWFRDQNVQQPINVPLDDTTVTGVNTGDYVTDLVLGGKPFIANKYHDYFTSCLPGPQKGPDVTISLADVNLNGSGSVYTGEVHDAVGTPTPMTFGLANNGSSTRTLSSGTWVLPGVNVNNTVNIPANSFNNNVGRYAFGTGTSSDAGNALIMAGNGTTGLYPNNLYSVYNVSLTDAPVVTINQLRQAFQIQKFYEQQARGGSRYRELLRSMFGVTSPDARMQIPEYLGGNRVPININQVVQMSATNSTSPQGNVAGQSLTADSHGDFIKSFTEHGYILGLCVARYDHTYQQGIPRMFSRKSLFDFYFPVFANLGEKAVFNQEIYAQGTAEDEEVFGYQEAWAEYRYRSDIVTGEMRSEAQNSLDVWHFADDYEALPSLSASWMQEDKTNIDRALAVTSQVSNQFWIDFFIENECTRPMPMYSIPGLIDHH